MPDRYEWDDIKRAANRKKHGLDFADIERFHWESAMIVLDNRFAYGEAREIAIGWLDGRLHFVAFQDRGARTRLISLRRTTPQEGRLYAAWARANEEGRDFP